MGWCQGPSQGLVGSGKETFQAVCVCGETCPDMLDGEEEANAQFVHSNSDTTEFIQLIFQ